MISTENSLSVGGGKDWLILELPNYWWCLLFLLCQNKFLEHFLEPAPPLKVTQVAISTECTRRSSFSELCACIVCPADVVGHHSVCQCVCWSPVFAVIGPKEGDHKKFDLSPLLKEVQVPIQIIPFSNQKTHNKSLFSEKGQQSMVSEKPSNSEICPFANHDTLSPYFSTLLRLLSLATPHNFLLIPTVKPGHQWLICGSCHHVI